MDNHIQITIKKDKMEEEHKEAVDNPVTLETMQMQIHLMPQ